MALTFPSALPLAVMQQPLVQGVQSALEALGIHNNLARALKRHD